MVFLTLCKQTSEQEGTNISDVVSVTAMTARLAPREPLVELEHAVAIEAWVVIELIQTGVTAILARNIETVH
jgi:hypothetical protein